MRPRFARGLAAGAGELAILGIAVTARFIGQLRIVPVLHFSTVLMRRLITSSGRAAVTATLLVGLNACAPDTAAEKPVATDPEAAAAAARGEAIVSGTAPAATGGLSAIVVLMPKEPREFPPQASKPVMDQISQTFTPPVLFVRTGQAAEFRNSDDVLHNIRTRHDETKESAFNIALPTGQTFEYAFLKDGFYDVGCDIHPAMSAVIIASTSPYTAQAAADGTFAVPNVTPGAYTLTVYADVRKIERDVEVTPGRTTVGDIKQ